MSSLRSKIDRCRLCAAKLPLEPKPILQFSKKSKALLIGQAPGIKAHESGIPWNDKSGERLRSWLNITDEDFYNPDLFAIIPMAFCYPGRGKSGDVPPPKECAPTWMPLIRDYLKEIELEIYVGRAASDYHFDKKKPFSDLIREQALAADNRVVLPHPSPRNNIWLAKNPWFEEEVLPICAQKVAKALSKLA